MIVPTHLYHLQLQAFGSRLVTDVASTHPDTSVSYQLETGRLYDHIRVLIDGKIFTKYFVMRDSGDIHGAKSDTLINSKQYFGNIGRAHLWFWGGVHGKPVDDTSVRVRRIYRGYPLYEQIPS